MTRAARGVLDTQARRVLHLGLVWDNQPEPEPDAPGPTRTRPMTVGELLDLTPFRMAALGWATPTSRVVVQTGWRYGVKLYTAGQSRARVQWVGGQEENLPVDVEVEQLATEPPPSEPLPDEGSTPHQSPQEGDTMATQTDATEEVRNAKTRALQARYTFQHQQVAKAVTAGDVDKIEMSEKRVADIAAEAATLGIELVEPEVDEDGNVDAAATQTKVNAVISKVTAGKGTGAKSDPEMDQTMASKKAAGVAAVKSVAGKAEKDEVKKAALAAASKAAGVTPKVPKVAKPKAEPKPKKEKALPSTQDCLCGCGLETGGKFRPGHDARVKGMLYKVERGEAKFADLPESLRPHVKFAGRAATAGKEDGDYRIVSAPVKFPGRPEIAVV